MAGLKELSRDRKMLSEKLAEREKDCNFLYPKVMAGVDPLLKEAAERARTRREEAVRLHALGEVDHAAIDRARKELEKARQAVTDAEEVFEAVREAYENAKRDRGELLEAYRLADRNAWNALGSQLVDKIKSNAEIRKLVHSAFCARAKGRDFHLDFDGFCADLFEDRSLYCSDELALELEREYLK